MCTFDEINYFDENNLARFTLTKVVCQTAKEKDGFGSCGRVRPRCYNLPPGAPIPDLPSAVVMDPMNPPPPPGQRGSRMDRKVSPPKFAQPRPIDPANPPYPCKRVVQKTPTDQKAPDAQQKSLEKENKPSGSG